MYRNNTPYILPLILTAGITLGVNSIAADTAQQVAQQVTAPAATNTENPAFAYSARKMLGMVSEARIAIGNKSDEAAIAYIDESLRELDGIRNARDYLEMMGIRFGRVSYGADRSYYIPIADDTYAVRTYARGPFWSENKTTAVRDVDVVNIDIAINPEKSVAHLEAAKSKIGNKDYNGADSELKNLLDDSIHETTKTDQPLVRLQDNMYLTRILIRQENYSGARYTLKHAKAALNDYEKHVTDPARRTDVASLRSEIDSLDEVIQRRNPTLLKKAADKVDGWWEKLKAWTQDKTS